MVRRIILAAVVALAPLSVAFAAAADTPRVGSVTGDRVNLRAGPSQNDPSIGFASRGESLTVLGKRAEWYQVRCPQGASVWIHSKFVSPDGIVTGSRVNLRPRPNTTHSALGQSRKGDRVTVRSKKGDWIRISAPTTATAWIHSKYVKISGTPARTVPVSASRPKMPARRPRNKIADLAYRYLDVEKEKAPEVMDMSPPIRLFEEVLASDASDDVKADAKKGLAEAERWKRISDVMRKVNAPVPAMPTEIHAYPAPRLRSNNEDDYLAVGWIVGRGKLLFGKASHRLSRGKQTVYLLKSSDYRLNDFVGKRVGISGSVIGWEGGLKVVSVEEIHIFGDQTG